MIGNENGEPDQADIKKDLDEPTTTDIALTLTPTPVDSESNGNQDTNIGSTSDSAQESREGNNTETELNSQTDNESIQQRKHSTIRHYPNPNNDLLSFNSCNIT